MPLVDIKIEPGFYTESTDRGALNHWKDGDHVRFRYGLPEKIGGWTQYNSMMVEPPVRAQHSWSSLDNQLWLALASDNRLYVINNDVLYDITPDDLPAIAGDGSELGWGAGPYGIDNDPNYLGDGWGTPRAAQNVRQELPIWSLDNWGEDLMACRRGGPIYIWERSNGPTTKARIIPNAPIASNWILVSPEDRILVSYGSHDGERRDQSLIRWCSREDYNDWTPSLDNSAGDKRVDSGSRILSAARTRNETVIWTDTSIYSQASVGDPDIFQFQPKGESLSIVGPNAGVEAGGVIYFMARDEFVRYDGTTQILPCTVRNYIFGRLDRAQSEKVYASVNKEQSEVWWFYPSQDAADNDSYVIFNYREGTWYYGTMARTAYTDSGFLENPVAVDPDGTVYLQEVGRSANAQPMASFVKSYAAEIENIGQSFAHVDKFIPDFLSLDSAVFVSFEARPYPRGETTSKGPFTVGPQTKKTDFRVRGRQIAITIYDDGSGGSVSLWTADSHDVTADQITPTADGFLSITSGSDPDYTYWRFGTFRVNVRPDGMR